MNIPNYTCLECGLESRYGDFHRMDCSSKELMKSYVRVFEEISKFPQDMLDKLSFAIYCETQERANQD